jgi:predicted component of type VI protein secretion system
VAEQESIQTEQTAWEDLDQNSFASLLQKEFKPKSENAKTEVEKAVNTFLKIRLIRLRPLLLKLIKSYQSKLI